MSMQGWYPDPGGASGRYRYWDGKTWSTDTAADPREAAPSAPTVTGAPRPRSQTGLLLGVILLVVVLVAASVLIARTVRAGTDPEVDPPAPTISIWDDSSPTPTRPPSPGAPSSPLVPCPAGDPGALTQHPHDGRVHGGNLSFAAVASFSPPVVEARFSFAHDVAQQTLTVDPDPKWYAQLAVGRLRGRDGFTHGSQNTAESVAQCLVSGNMYVPFGPHRADVRSTSVKVSGRAGWLIESNVTVRTPGLDIPGDHVVFIVVPDGADWGMFFAAVPIGDVALNRVLTDTIADLRAG